MKLTINNITLCINEENYNPQTVTKSINLNGLDSSLFSDVLDSSILSIFNIECEDSDDLLKVVCFCADNGHLIPTSKSVEIIIESNNLDDLEYFAKERVKFMYAAGGVVYKNDQTLFIYRLDKWDLPKGKIEKGEEQSEAALREVEEECNVSARLEHYLGSTWHAYLNPYKKNKWVIKETYWYVMECLNDQDMKPQEIEGIELVEWKSIAEIEVAMQNTFPNIKLMVVAYRKYRGL